MALATNLQLTYDDATNQWNFTEVAYDYGAQTAPSWSGYTATDPAFEYATEGAATTTATKDFAEGDDPCPPGYVYDNNLKQCVSDPTYEAPAYAGQPKGEYSSEAGPSERIQESTYGAGYPQTMGQFTATDMRNYGIEKGFVDEFGNVSKPAAEEGFLGTIANLGRQTDYDQYINHLKKKGLFNEDIVAGNPMGTGKILSRPEDYATSISPEKFLEQYGVEGKVGENDTSPWQPTSPSTFPSGPKIMGEGRKATDPAFQTDLQKDTALGKFNTWSNYALNITPIWPGGRERFLEEPKDTLGITAPSYGQRQPFFRQQDVSGGAMSIGERMQHEQDKAKLEREQIKTEIARTDLASKKLETKRGITGKTEYGEKVAPTALTYAQRMGKSKYPAVGREARQKAEKAMTSAANRESKALRAGNREAAREARGDYERAVERAGYSRK